MSETVFLSRQLVGDLLVIQVSVNGVERSYSKSHQPFKPEVPHPREEVNKMMEQEDLDNQFAAFTVEISELLEEEF